MKIIIKPLSNSEWDLSRTPAYSRRKDIDAHLRKEGSAYALTVFDSQIKRADDAYLEDIKINRCPSGPNWNQVLIAMSDYKKP